MWNGFGGKRREERRENERMAARLKREVEINAARSQLVEEIRIELGEHTRNHDKHLDQQFVCEKDLHETWTISRIERLSAGLEWGEGRQAQHHQLRAKKDFIKILSILVIMNWDNWTKFAELFLYNTGWEDKDLPYDPRFLSQSNRSLFRTMQYMFIPIIIEEGEGPPYDCLLRMPFMASEHLGEGSYGVVKKQLIAPGHLRRENRGRGTNDEPVWVACKVIPGNKAERPYGTAGTTQKPFISEHRNLQYFKKCLTKNENVMLSIATFTHGTDFVIISDLADLDLHKFFHGHGLAARSSRFTPLALLKEASNLCGALHFIHEDLRLSSRKISCAHLDLHPSNILVTWLQDDTNDPVGRWQLHDFGISRIKSPRDAEYDAGRSASGTPLAPGEFIKNNFSLTSSKRAPGAFMAPEIGFDDKAVGQESDMWSFGCILAVLVAFAVGGPASVIAFQDARLKDFTPHRAQTDYFYKPGEGNSHIVKPSVMEYLTALVNDPGEDEWISKTINLISKMLQVDIKQRQKTTAKALREELEFLCRDNGRDNGFYLNRAFGWTRKPIIDYYTKSLQSTDTLAQIPTTSTGPLPRTPRITESELGSSPPSLSQSWSKSSGYAIPREIQDRLMSPRSVTKDEKCGLLAFDTPKEPVKIAISPGSTHFAYVTKDRAVIHMLSGDADWKLSKSLALKSVTMKPYFYTSAGAEFFQVSIAGSYVLLRSTTIWKDMAPNIALHRLLCTDQNNWILNNLPIYDLEGVASKIQEANQVIVSCRGDLLLLWDNSLCLCNTQRLRELVKFEYSRIISASFSQDGLWIYCWAKNFHKNVEYWYIWDVLKGELVSNIPSKSFRPLDRPGYGRNSAFPCSNFFITSEKTHQISAIGKDKAKEKVEVLPTTIRDVVAGVSFQHNARTTAESLVLIKHSELPASDSLFTISLSNYGMSTGLKLSCHFLPDRDGLAITQRNGKVFAIVCHAEGLIEKVQIASYAAEEFIGTVRPTSYTSRDSAVLGPTLNILRSSQDGSVAIHDLNDNYDKEIETIPRASVEQP